MYALHDDMVNIIVRDDDWDKTLLVLIDFVLQSVL